MNEKLNLVFDAEIRATDINEVKSAVNRIKNQLNGLKMPAAITKGFEKKIQSLSDELVAFEALTSQSIESLADVKKAEASWNKISLLIGKIKVGLADLQGDTTDVFPKDVVKNITEANEALAEYEKKLRKIRGASDYKNKDSALKKAERTRDNARAEYQRASSDFRADRAQVGKNAAEWNRKKKEYQDNSTELAQNAASIDSQTKALQKQEAILQKLANQKVAVIERNGRARLSKNFEQNLEKLKSDIDQRAKELEDLYEKLEEAEGSFDKKKKAKAAAQGQVTKLQNQGAKTDDPKLKEAERKLQEAQDQLAAAEKERKKLEAEIEKKESVQTADKEKLSQKEAQKQALVSAAKERDAIAQNIVLLEEQKKAIQANIDALEVYKRAAEAPNDVLAGARDRVSQAKKNFAAAEQEVADLKADLGAFETGQVQAEWDRLINILERATGLDLSSVPRDLDQIDDIIKNYRTSEMAKVPNILDDIADSAKEADGPIEEVGKGLDNLDESATSATNAQKHFENLKDSVLELFSITSAIEIFKDAVRSAFETVKELDAAMTETAVVTDFSIGDMWEQLPRYTQAANELGTTTLGAYETMTLFYQQGLQTNEVFEIGTETMKMARIAGLDYADATDKMTAALRGFNMELDETSARRVNDVYSELAAITAADTEEIANAMTKTASIAHNANMEFETTAAFLSQIIETTRESAETAGTAMKTVIARFQELKEDPSGLGEVDGEVVDANKIEGALRTVGVALRDSTGQFRDLDDVFLELASKWDDLDTNTQRYIATVAAGSRQQSRFIAMMSDYERTMELVNAANESAGASQKQFEKTTESLESKLNKLSNAWQQFTMGLANNQVIKWSVDLLTGLLNILNSITEWSGHEGLGGIITSFNKLLLTLMGLKGGGAIIKTFFTYFSIINEDAKGLHKFSSALKAAKETAGESSIAFAKMKTSFVSAKDSIIKGAKGIWGAIKGFGLGKFALIAGGTALAIGGLVAVFKHIKANSPEEKLKRAQQATEQASEAADAAAERYENLTNSLNGIEEGTKKIEELTRGTKAWKEAVEAVNEQFMELVEQYPELAPFIEFKDGVFTINYNKKNLQGQTYEDVYGEIEQSKINAKNIETAFKIEENALSRENSYAELDDLAKVWEWNADYGSIVTNRELTDQLARALVADPTLYTQNGIDEWFAREVFGKSSGALTDEENAEWQSLLAQNQYLDTEKLRAYGKSLIEGENLSEDLSQSIAANVLNTLDVTNQQAEVLGGFMSTERANQFYENAKKTVEAEGVDLEKLAEAAGWEKDGDDYYTGEGDNRKKVEYTKEQKEQAYAAVIAGEEIEKSYEGFLAAMETWGEGTLSYTDKSGQAATIDAKYIKQLFSDSEGGALTIEAIDALKAVGAAEIYRLGGGETNLGDQELFEAEFNRLIGSFDWTLAEVRNQIGNLQLEDDGAFQNNMEKLSIDASSAFVDKLTGLSKEDAQRITEKFNQIADGLDPQTLEDFTTQINGLDWTNLEEWNNLSTKLEALGIEVPVDELREFAIATSEATNAQRNQEFTELSALIGASSGLAADISEREVDERTFTQEEVNLLRQAAPDAEFTKIGEDEYIYLGDGLNNLATALTAWNQELIRTTPSFENATKQEQIDTYTTAYSSMDGAELGKIASTGDGVQAEAAQKVLDAKIAQEGLEKQVEKTRAAFAAQGKEVDKIETAIKALTVESNKNKKATKDLCSAVEDNLDAFKAGNKALENGEEASDDYYKALNSITEKAKEVFGDAINKDFVQSNYEAFEQLAQGGEVGAQAYEKIQAAARDSMLKSLEANEKIGSGIQDIKNLVATADLDFSVTGYADITDIVAKLTQAGYKISEVGGILESLLGASVSFEVQYQTVVVPASVYDLMYAGRSDIRANAIAGGRAYHVQIPSTIRAVGNKNSYSGSGWTPSSKGGGGSGGGSKGKEKWENPYDKLYNLTREINEELRERERIERRYQKLLKAHHTGAQNIIGVSEKELAHLQEEVDLQEKLIAGRKQQMNEYLKDNSSLSKYANIETNERGEQILRINWDAINKVTDEDKGQKIEDYISQLEEWLDSINEANDTLNEIQDVVEEIKERGKDEYFDLEERIKEALVQTYQNEIDKLSEINESINDTNSKLIDAMQSSIDKERQDRENAEREEEIADKQRQLAYLQQDTSGANDMAILQLQEEISQAQQDQTDALIDQKISELQEQNDKAAEQRQQQIDLAQAQLDHYIASGEIWQEVYGLMSEGLNKEDGLVRGSKLEEILKKTETFEGLSQIGQMEWLKELNANVASALAYLKVGRQLEDLGLKEGTSITFTTSDGKTITGKMDKQGNVTVDGKTYSDVYQGFDGNYYSDENYENKNKPVSTTPPPEEKPKDTPAEEWKPAVGNMVRITKGAKFVSGEKVMEAVRAEGVIAGKKGAFKVLKDKGNGNFYVGREWSDKGVTGLINKKYLTKYKTGGLADFTGPAWLDGTKSKPEMVLNSRDTQNFIQLKNILSELLARGGIGAATENSGDNTYDIDINVDTIGSDYDLDKLASKVRSMINGAAQYRNNNAISLKR